MAAILIFAPSEDDISERFFKKNLKKFLKNKNKSPLKIRMFAKNWTLIEGLEKKI